MVALLLLLALTGSLSAESVAIPDLDGVRILELVMEASGDNVDTVHVVWAEGTLTYTCQKRQCVVPPSPVSRP